MGYPRILLLLHTNASFSLKEMCFARTGFNNPLNNHPITINCAKLKWLTELIIHLNCLSEEVINGIFFGGRRGYTWSAESKAIAEVAGSFYLTSHIDHEAGPKYEFQRADMGTTLLKEGLSMSWLSTDEKT